MCDAMHTHTQYLEALYFRVKGERVPLDKLALIKIKKRVRACDF